MSNNRLKVNFDWIELQNIGKEIQDVPEKTSFNNYFMKLINKYNADGDNQTINVNDMWKNSMFNFELDNKDDNHYFQDYYGIPGTLIPFDIKDIVPYEIATFQPQPKKIEVNGFNKDNDSISINRNIIDILTIRDIPIGDTFELYPHIAIQDSNNKNNYIGQIKISPNEINFAIYPLFINDFSTSLEINNMLNEFTNFDEGTISRNVNEKIIEYTKEEIYTFVDKIERVYFNQVETAIESAPFFIGQIIENKEPIEGTVVSYTFNLSFVKPTRALNNLKVKFDLPYYTYLPKDLNNVEVNNGELFIFSTKILDLEEFPLKEELKIDDIKLQYESLIENYERLEDYFELPHLHDSFYLTPLTLSNMFKGASNYTINDTTGASLLKLKSSISSDSVNLSNIINDLNSIPSLAQRFYGVYGDVYAGNLTYKKNNNTGYRKRIGPVSGRRYY